MAVKFEKAKPRHLFLNDLNQIHWYWRFVIFMAVFFVLSYFILQTIHRYFPTPKEISRERDILILLPNAVMAVTVGLISWAALRFLDRRKFQSIGLAFHPGWRHELFFGLVVGSLLPLFIGVTLWLSGQIYFSFRPMGYAESWTGILISLGVWISLVTFYELVFRGYLLQTIAEGAGRFTATIFISVFYGFILGSGHTTSILPVINVALAGFMYTIIYFRTRSLWPMLGLHFGWNFVQSYFLGSRVEAYLSSSSIYTVTVDGPDWLTGGHFGMDGGIIGTIFILLFLLYTSQTRHLTMNAAMKKIKFEALTQSFIKKPENDERRQ